MTTSRASAFAIRFIVRSLTALLPIVLGPVQVFAQSTGPSIPATMITSQPIPYTLALDRDFENPFMWVPSGTGLLDINNDGLFDVILAPSHFLEPPLLPVVALLQNADGTFTESTAQVFPQGVPRTGTARTVIVADFNNDGHRDYFAADHGLEDAAFFAAHGHFEGSTNRLFLSDGAGHLIDAQSKLPTFLGFNHGASAGDVRRNGKLDIVVNPLGTDVLFMNQYFLENTSSAFVLDNSHLPAELATYDGEPPIFSNLSSSAIADLNGDGWPDLIVSAYTPFERDGVVQNIQGTRIYYNDGNGNFIPSTTTLPHPQVGRPIGSTSIHVLDANGDGKPDFLVAYEGEAGLSLPVQLWTQMDNRSFVDKTLEYFGTYTPVNFHFREIDVVDFNNDGTPDIFFRRWVFSELFNPGAFAKDLGEAIFINDGQGHFVQNARPITGINRSFWPGFVVAHQVPGQAVEVFSFEQNFDSNKRLQSITPFKIILRFQIGDTSSVPADFDGDGETDVTVYQTSSGNWFFVQSASGFDQQLNFGGPSFLPVPGDYDADGVADTAVYQTTTGNWFVVGSSTGFFTPALNFGGTGFIPVPADYDGDGKTDAAVYQSSSGNWFIQQSGGGLRTVPSFGGAGFVPVPGDYDGDGKIDVAVYQTSTGNWFVVGSTAGFFTPALSFGGSGFIPAPGDYDGDGKSDAAVYQSSTGNWFALGSMSGFHQVLNFGGSGFTPVAGDYDGDGKTDVAVYQQSTGNWFVVGSTSGFFTPALNFGGSGFVPVLPQVTILRAMGLL